MSKDQHPTPATTEEPDSKKQKTESGASSSSNSSSDSSNMSSAAGKYTLFSYWRSGASWRVRIALAYKNISYDLHPINLLKNEQTSESYHKLNPSNKVPLLVLPDGKRSIAQSMAIIDYLDAAHPDTPRLLPKDPFTRAKALAIAEGVNADTQPIQNLRVLNRVGSIAGDAAKAEWGKWACTDGLSAIEANTKESAGKYCVGDEITVADVCLVPQLSAARRFNVDLTAFPTLLRIEAELAKHPAFIAGHANSQADKPEGMAPIE